MKTRNNVFSKLSYFMASALLVAPAFFYSNGAIAAGNAFDAIPASNCMPRNITSVRKLELIGGAWKFRTNQKGTAYLECPVETLGTTGPTFARGFLVYFQDTDGVLTDTNINYSLIKRENGVFTSVGTYDTSTANTTEATLAYKETLADIGVELWYVRVEMKRLSTSQQAIMGGILVID